MDTRIGPHRTSGNYRAALALGALIATGCSGYRADVFDDHGFDGVTSQTFALLGTSCTFDASGNMTVTIGDGEIGYLSVRPTDGLVVLNANTASGAECSVATTKTINVNSAGGDPATAVRKLYLDYYNGQYALGTKSGFGLKINLAKTGTESNSLVVRGTTGIDQYYFGASGFNVNSATDAFPDVQLTGITNVTVAAGPGNDVLYADGGKGTGNSLAVPVTFWGGDNDDTLVGGVGGTPANPNVLNGGNGNDTFTQTATLSADQVVGGAGTDVVDYSIRTLAISVILGDATANDGDVAAHSGSGEQDEVGADVENVLGGAGNDVIDCSQSGNKALVHSLSGNAGNDTITGGDGNDTIDGGAGDDTIIGGLGDDTLIGGAGIDTVDYTDHTAAVTVSMVYVSGAQCGAAGEKDVFNNNSKGPDVENLRGSPQADTLTGNATANVIWGGAGADTIKGGNGNDTIYGDDGDDTLCGNDCAGAGAVGTDDDRIVGGLGKDTFKGDGGNNFIDANDGVEDVSADCGSGTAQLWVFDSADTAAGSAFTSTNCSFQ